MDRSSRRCDLALAFSFALCVSAAHASIEPRPVFPIDPDPAYGPLWVAAAGSAVVVSDAPNRIFYTRGTPGSTVEIPLPAPAESIQLLSQSVALGDVLIFRGVGSSEFLFRTDGTIEGTYLLKESARNGDGGVLFTSGRWAYFQANLGARMFWRTDGTREGTTPLPSWVTSLSPVRGGVAAGPLVLRDSANSFEPMVPLPPSGFRQVLCGSEMALLENSQPDEYAWWWFDGVNFRRDASFSTQTLDILLSDAGTRRVIYMAAPSDSPPGYSLWSYSPDTASITEHARLPTRRCGFSRVVVNGHVVMSMESREDGEWRKRIWSSSIAGGFSGYLLDDTAGDVSSGRVVAAGGRAYFSAVHDGYGRELWSSDGTPDGTRLVADLRAGPGSSMTGYCSIVAVKNRVYFGATDGQQGRGLWVVHVQPADFNNNGSVGVQDVFDFVGAFLSGKDLADSTRDGLLGVDDLYNWLASYFMASE